VGDYRVDEQIGMFIRRAHQRASAIFARHFAEAGLSPAIYRLDHRARPRPRVRRTCSAG
jgi:hypothetical protein